jgi:2,4-dienoyl-CoA reductase-like NADH-dependent reductase (Old Yellow Enzyme family)/NADPH-dependent 2,4-dienoyl-CoA reductase/sulfur reductase-like enzyme
MKYKNLFSPVTIGKLHIKNRIVMPAMGTGMANFDGTPSEQLIAYYEERAKSGTGLIISEITRVNDLHGATMPRQLSMSHNRYIKPYSLYVERMHSAGAKVFCQLHHPGRQNMSVMVLFWPILLMTGRIIPSFWKFFPKMVPAVMAFMEKVWAPRVVAPSAVPCGYTQQKTRALRLGEINNLVSDFVQAAERVQKSGADGVEIHASHGYLIQQFLSSRTNKRTDRYGGSTEKRLNFLLEIISGIKKQCGDDFPISVRLTVEEYYDQPEDRGITLDEGLVFAEKLEEAGIDLLNISSGTYETMNSWLEPISYEPGWRKDLSSAVRKQVKIPVLGASFIRTPELAEQLISSGNQDMVAVGRGQIADPQWTLKAAEGRPEEIRRCISCLNCFDSLNRNAAMGKPFQCSLNPRLGFEYEKIAHGQNGSGKRAVVIGAGPAGLFAADMLSAGGFSVDVFEKESSVGGQLKIAGKPPFKEKIEWLYEDLLQTLNKREVRFHYSIQPEIRELKEIQPHIIVAATGGIPLVPSIPGVEREFVYSYVDILLNKKELKNQNIIVVGSGMSGLETAEKLSEKNNKITVVEMRDAIGPGLYKQNLDDVLSRLKKTKTVFKTKRKLIRIEDNAVLLENTENDAVEKLDAECVVLALGVRSNNAFTVELEKEFENVITVGDASKPGRIFDAVHDTYKKICY